MPASHDKTTPSHSSASTTPACGLSSMARPAARALKATGAYEGHEGHAEATVSRHPADMASTVQDARARAQEAQAQVLGITGAQIVWTLPPDGIPTGEVVSAEWCAYTGQSREQAAGLASLDAVHPDDLPTNLAVIQQAQVERRPYQVQCRIRRHDGVYQSFLMCGTPLWTASGQLRQWVGTLTNMSAYEEARQDRAALLAHEAELSHATVQAAHRAQVAEERFRRLVDANLIGVLLANQDCIVEANDAFLRIVGYTREDLEAGRVRWREMTPPEYLPLDEQGIAQLLERGECTPYEKEYVRKDDRSRVPILIGAALLEREPLQWVCFVTDMSELKRLEREVAERAALLQAAFDAQGDALFVYDSAGQVLRFNAAGRALLRLDMSPEYAVRHQAQVLGQQLELRDAAGLPLPMEHWPLFRALRGETLTDASAADVVFRALDGSVRHTSVSAAPIRATQGTITGAVLAIRDVTEQRKLEARTERQASMLERTYDAIFLWQLGGAITFWNRGAERLYGYPSEDAIGRASHDLLHTRVPESMGSIAGLEEELLRAGEWSGELTHTTRDGREVHILSHQQVLHEADGTVSVFETARDITERKEMERALAERAAELEHANQRLDEFLHIVTHELRTPLTVLKAGLGIAQRRLRRRSPPPSGIRRDDAGSRDSSRSWGSGRSGAEGADGGDERRTAVQPEPHSQPQPDQQVVDATQPGVMDRHLNAQADADGVVLQQLHRAELQADRLARLLDDLANAARARTGKLELRPVPCDLTGAVRICVEEQRRVTKRSIRLHAPTDGSVPVIADSDRIEQVLTNYLTNAAKYSPPETPIAVTLTVADGSARVAVRDQGPGLTAEEQQQVWGRLHQVGRIPVEGGTGVGGTGVGGAGLGLGLYISQSIIEGHGGQVGVKSAVGRGSTFWFTLPLATQALTAEEG